MSHWYERLPRRLGGEIEAMNKRFPYFKLYRTKSGILYWKGTVKPCTSCRIYTLRLTYPSSFPHADMRIEVLSPKLNPSPHRLGPQELCAFHWTSETPRTPEISAAEYVTYASTWLLAYEYHQRACRKNNGRPCTVNGCEHWTGKQHTVLGIVHSGP